MHTLETDIEISADGRLQLLSPLPTWLRPGRSHVLLVMSDGGRGSGASAESTRVEKTANVCGGDACIASTRIPVWTLEQSRRLGFSDAELLDAFPSLQHEDLAVAWSYVAANADEIERAIQENEAA